MLENASPGPLVFVVDGDRAVREALRFSLEVEGYQVALCDSGEALLSRVVPDGPLCVVLDQRLPGITGLATLEALQRRRGATPAVLIAGQPRGGLRAAAEAAGVALVEKPLMGAALLDAIENALAG